MVGLAQLVSASGCGPEGRGFESHISPQEKKQIAKAICFFQLYSPAASSMHFVRDMSFGRDMRFARWKLQGEYNITATAGSNITFAEQKYHADEVSISLKLFTTPAQIFRKRLAISTIFAMLTVERR